MIPKLKMQKKVERMLAKEDFKYVRVDGVGWKIPDGNIGYSWLEYQGSAHEDKVMLSVDKFHGLVIYY